MYLYMCMKDENSTVINTQCGDGALEDKRVSQMCVCVHACDEVYNI